MHARIPIVAVAVLSSSHAVASDDIVPEQAVVRLLPGFSIADFNRDHGTAVLDSIPQRRTWLLDLPDGIDEDQFELQIEDDPRVEDAELNDLTDAPGGQTQSFYFSIDPPAFGGQYAWDRINLPVAGPTGQGVVVAIVDTGIDLDHPAFASVQILQGWDFVDDDATPAEGPDGNDADGDGFIDEMTGHGTFQTGLVTAIAPDAAILPIRVLDGDGLGEAFRVAKAVFYAIDQGADVINLSLGSLNENDILEDALELAKDAGIVVVTSAGNLGDVEPTVYPAAFSEVIAVASIDASDVKSEFSSCGGHVALCAPGTAIVSAVDEGGFGQADGTSGAAALVSGAAALLVQTRPELTPEQIADVLETAAVDIDASNPGWVGTLGGGRLDVAGALDLPIDPDGDANGDGLVDVLDVLEVLSSWGAVNSPADVDGDGVVGVNDLLVVLSNFT